MNWIDRLLGHSGRGSTGWQVYTDDDALMAEMREAVAAIPPVGRVVPMRRPATA